ncbi:MAG: transglutaminase family protein [Rhodospirillales bacterium]|nr:transglutaminase family protein [Rhodospirillales bacterium]
MNAPAVPAIAVVTAEPPAPGARLLAPLGAASGLGSVANLHIAGGRIVETLCEIETGQPAAIIEPSAQAPLRLTYRFVLPTEAPRYPEAAFAPRANRYTRAAAELLAASRRIAAEAGGGRNAIDALVAEARARFTYDHSEIRFNDRLDEVPLLGCGLMPGSCVDINTYLVASLRAAGFEAAYVYGYFFPAEKGDWTDDMHCWVATRHGGEVLEWDIAHHIKAGHARVLPGLNPRPGRRALIGHSMGHRYDARSGPIKVKLLAEPVWLMEDDAVA